MPSVIDMEFESIKLNPVIKENMQKFFAIIMVLAAVGLCANVTINGEDIGIQLSKIGSAHVIEDYKITLLNIGAVNEFENLKQIGKTDIAAWTLFSSDIKQHLIGDAKDITIFTQDKLGVQHVTIEYNIEHFTKLKQREGRFETWTVAKDQFTYYDNTTNTFILPEKTSLEFLIEDTRKDKSIELKEFIEAKPTAFFNNPFFQADSGQIGVKGIGPVSLQEFEINYKIELTIGESFGVSSFSFFQKNPIYLGIIVLLLVLTLIYRKQVRMVLSESFSGEEEIEMPKRKRK